MTFVYEMFDFVQNKIKLYFNIENIDATFVRVGGSELCSTRFGGRPRPQYFGASSLSP